MFIYWRTVECKDLSTHTTQSYIALHCMIERFNALVLPTPLPRGIETSHVLWKPGPVWGWLTNLATLGRNLTCRRLASRRPEGCGVTAERQEMKEVWPWIGGAKLCGLGTAPARAKARRRLHTATCTHYTLWGPPDATSFEEYVRWFIYNMG